MTVMRRLFSNPVAYSGPGLNKLAGGVKSGLCLSLNFEGLAGCSFAPYYWFMAKPLPPGLPPGFWDDYRKRYEDEIAHMQEQLAPLEKGELRVVGNGRDETQHWIAYFHGTIRKYQGIVDAVKRGELP